jgi:hypothetical protein
MCYLRRRIWPIALYLIGFAVFFRYQLYSDFDLQFGHGSDDLFVVFIHEHVFQWILGHNNFLSPPYYFDQKNILGYSEVLLLDQLIYAPCRLLGADPFLATSLVAVTLSALCFTSSHALLRRLGVSVGIASFGAVIVTFANNLYVTAAQLQHFTIYFLPLTMLCAVKAVEELHRSRGQAYGSAAIGAFLFGLTFSTGFYIAWFFAVELAIFIPFFLFRCPPAALRWLWADRGSVAVLVAVSTASFIVGLIPCAIIYVSIAASMGYRNLFEYLSNAPELLDIVNVGPNNVIWGSLITSFGGDRFRFSEVLSLAITPTLQFLLLASACFSVGTSLWSRDYRGQTLRAVAIAASAAPIVLFLLVVKIGNVSLFGVLYSVVPGAGAIRVGYRGMLVANVFATVSVAMSSDRLLESFWQPVSAYLATRSLLIGLLVVAIVEQFNLAQSAAFSRSLEREHLARIGSAPERCRSFYVADETGYTTVAVQLDAMIVSMIRRVPTINGYSGFRPPDWDFYSTKDRNYERRAVNWASRRGLAPGLCRLDIQLGAWTAADNDPALACLINKCVSFASGEDFRFEFKQGGNGEFFTGAGWSVPEPAWGRWTSDRQAKMSFTLTERHDYHLTISLRAFVVAQDPVQSVWIDANECRISSAAFDLRRGVVTQELEGTIPENCIDRDGIVVLKINTDRLLRPADIGLNTDQRRLGVGVEMISLKR